MRALPLLAGAVVLSGTLWWVARFAGLGAQGRGVPEAAACGPSPAESPSAGSSSGPCSAS